MAPSMAPSMAKGTTPGPANAIPVSQSIKTESSCSRCCAVSNFRTRGEGFCDACFLDFVTVRFRKQMGAYRVNYLVQGIPTLVVDACNISINALALTDLLLLLLEHQQAKNGGRVGFSLEAVHVGEPPASWPFEQVQLYSIPESEAFARYEMNGQPVTAADLAQLPRSAQQDLRSQLISRCAESWAASRPGSHARLVQSLSMNDVAQRVLAEVSKGRGAALTAMLSPEDQILPLRELLDRELAHYADLRHLTGSAVPPRAVPGITRLRSIDEVVSQYFADVQREFPAVVSTVAVTASKLSQPPEKCGVCGPNLGAICYACAGALRGVAGGSSLRLRNDLSSVLSECAITNNE